MWEFTREEQFIGATTRHPMTTHVKLGAKQDGTLTAIQIRVVSNTGAYGGHAGETLAAAMSSPIIAYNCVNKKGDGYAVTPTLFRPAASAVTAHRKRPSPSNAPWTNLPDCWASIPSRSAART